MRSKENIHLSCSSFGDEEGKHEFHPGLFFYICKKTVRGDYDKCELGSGFRRNVSPKLSHEY